LVAVNRPVAGSSLPALVGPYRILRLLGEGGTARVYLAEQLQPFRRVVALKTLRNHLLSQDAVFRFEQELQTLARLRHDHIAQVFDYGARGRETPYFTMEYVDGPSISDFADRRRLDVRARLKLFLQVCEAVQYIHQNGVIHRDIKASNVLVQSREDASSVKLIDFGIAKLSREHRHEQVPATDEGRILGTLGYLSPEQVDDKAIDIRADIYALGVLLYELLTGSLPIEAPRRAEDVPALLRRLREERPPLASRRVMARQDAAEEVARCRGTSPGVLAKELQDDLDWILNKALEKKPDDRYATAADMARDLRAHLRGEAISAGPESGLYHLRRAVRRNLRYVAAALLAVGMVAAAVALSAFWHLRLGAEHQRRVRFLRLDGAVQVRVANAHLWLEEALSGDPEVDLSRDVHVPLEEASTFVQAALRGGTTPFGEFEPAGDAALEAVLRELASRLEEFRAISRSRWVQRFDRGGTGSALDREFDSLYQDILATNSSLTIAASRKPLDDQASLSRTLLVVNVLAAASSLALLVAVARSWAARSRQIGSHRND